MKGQPELRSPEGRLYAPLMLSTAGTLALMGVALGILMVAAMIGPFRLFRPEPGRAAAPLGLWLLREPDAQTDAGERLRVSAWREVVASGRTVREARGLAPLIEGGVSVIAVPDARRLGDHDVRALRRYLQDGGGVVLAGSLGVRDRDGRWRGYELMQQLLEVDVVSPRPRAASRFLAPAARGPLSAAVAPSQRVPLVVENGVPGIVDPRAELRWADGSGASRRLEPGRGRLVWLAAGPEAEAGAREPISDARLAHVIEAALAWAGREPFLELLAWPGGARLAAAVEAGAAGGRGAKARLPRELLQRLDARIADAGTRGALLDLSRVAAELGASAIPPLAAYAEPRLRAGGAWIARPGEVAAWARRRAGLEASLVRAGPRRYLLSVANRNREPVAGAALRVHLNLAVEAARVERTIVQQEEPAVEVDLARARVDVALPALRAGARTVYALDLDLTEDRG